MNTPTKTHDMIDILVEDHREVEDLFQRLEQPGADPQRRSDLLSAAIAELVRHSVAEEQYLYPVTREKLADGDEIADREIDEHSEAEEMMKRLEGMETTEADFDPTLRALMSEVREHIADEENNLFPRLRQSCSQEQLAELGKKVERAKKVAPTRPHPNAPDTPPANKLLGPGVGMVDRLRDTFSKRPTSPDDVV